MKFCLTATIAIYFLFTLLFSTLSTNASQEKNEHSQIILSTQTDYHQNHSHNHTNREKVFEQKWKTFSRLLLGKNKLQKNSLLLQSKNNILFWIVNQFLTCKDLIVLRQTCEDFQYLVHPNQANMVTFCTYGASKTMTDTNIIWKDLKYFLNQSYYSAFYEMKMFNIKTNEYVVVTHLPEEKYIVWNNNSTRYDQMLLDQTTQCTPCIQNSYETNFEPIEIFNKAGNAWTIITKQGNVITDGDARFGGDSSFVQSQLVNVKMICSTFDAFTALLDDGIVVAWGSEYFGDKIPNEIKTQLVNVKLIFSANNAFAALLDDGTVVAWGDEHSGGEIPHDIQNKLMKNVKMIFSTNYAFAALLNDDTVVAWGHPHCGGEIPDEIQTQLIDVKQIIPKERQFKVLCKNGKLYTW